MSEKVKKIRVKQTDGTMSDYIPIGANAEDIDLKNGLNVEQMSNKKPYYFNSVADMKAAEYLKEGDCAITLGYYKTNDGGGGTYKIRFKTNDDVEDNGSIHFIGQNLVAELIVEKNTINVLNFGLKSDGTYDNTTLFINVVKYAFKNKFNIYFPSGTYNGNFALDLTTLYNSVPTSEQSKIHINISGSGRSSVLTNTSGSILALRGCKTDENGTTTDQRTIKWITISNLQINGKNNSNDNIGFELETCQNINLYDIEIFNCRQALVGKGAMDISISMVDFMRSGYIDSNNNVYYSIFLDKSSLVNLSSNAIKFANCRVEETPAIIRVRGSAYSIHFANCKFELGRENNISSYRPIYNDYAKNIIFTNCHFQYSKGYSSESVDIPTRLNNYSFIRVNNYEDYNINSGASTVFNSCDFCTNPNYKVLWFDGYNTNFNNCIFCGVDGSNGSRAFELRGKCNLTNNTAYMNGGHSIFSVRGNCNIVKNQRIILDSNQLSSSNGSAIHINTGATNNYIEMNREISTISNDVQFVSSSSTFVDENSINNYTSNIVKANDIKSIEYTESQINLRGNDFVIFKGTYFNKINHIYNGQSIKVLMKNQTNVNITGNIKTSTGEQKTFNANSLVEFIVNEGYLYEKS